MKRRPATIRFAASRGFTLIELMIAMVLGLVIVGSVLGVMVANKRTNRTTEGLAQVQETARSAFELLAHDIRQADGNGCTTSNPTDPSLKSVVNVLGGTDWWRDWVGFKAFDSSQTDDSVAIGTGTAQRVAGTDSIRVDSMDGTGLSVAQHSAVNYKIDINAASTDLVVGDIMVVCDYDHASIFQVSAYATGAGIVSVYHNTGGTAPGNCTKSLDYPKNCASTTGARNFTRNALIGRRVATDWYIGNNGRSATESGRSLYRRRLGAGGVEVVEEVVAGVTDMELQFKAAGTNSVITSPTLVTDWSTISTVLIQLTVQSGDLAVSTDNATNSGRIQRTFNYIVSLRNRLP